MQICGKILVLRLISYVQRARERSQTCFFSQIQAITQTTVIITAIIFTHRCVTCTVLIWTLILLTLRNRSNILLRSLNWPKPAHYVPTDKINDYSRSHSTNFESQNANFDQLRHITTRYLHHAGCESNDWSPDHKLDILLSVPPHRSVTNRISQHTRTR